MDGALAKACVYRHAVIPACSLGLSLRLSLRLSLGLSVGLNRE